MDSHYKVKKHKCDRCDMRFTYRTALNKHLQNNTCVKK